MQTSVWDIRIKVFGVDHMLTIETKMELVHVLQNRGELEKAREILRNFPHEKPVGWSDSNWEVFLANTQTPLRTRENMTKPKSCVDVY